MKLLIVDDSAIIRNIIQKIVNEAELDIEIAGEAPDAGVALRMFDEVQPDVVTMDITMPGMDGIDCMKEMLARRTETRVIIITSQRQNNLPMDALEQGAAAYLGKPVRKEKLKEILLSLKQ